MQGKIKNFFESFGNTKNYRKNDTILRSDEEPIGVYFLSAGYVRFYSITEDGRELTLNIFKPGTFFPMLWALGEMDNMFFFESITPAKVYIAPKDKFLSFLDQNQDIFKDLNKRLLVGLNALIIRMQYLLLLDASQKVKSVFIMLARRFADGRGRKNIRIDFPLTHKEISNLCCLTRETTSLEVKKLEKKGIIKRDKQFYIISDIDKLEKEARIVFEDKNLPYSFLIYDISF